MGKKCDHRRAIEILIDARQSKRADQSKLKGANAAKSRIKIQISKVIKMKMLIVAFSWFRVNLKFVA